MFRDRDVFEVIVDELKTTGEFALVLYAEPPELGTMAAHRAPAAFVVPEEWTEVEDANPSASIRHVAYALTLIVRHEDAAERIDRLDRLSNLAQNTLDGSDLNGGCLRALSKIRRGRYEPAPRHPERRLILSGSFGYPVPNLSAHNTAE